jgi:hypothetical protein
MSLIALGFVAALAAMFSLLKTSHRFSALLRANVVLFLALLPASVALAQTTTSGDLSGTVTDSHGAVIVGAEVKLVSQDTGTAQTVKTNRTGSYRVPLLKSGTYTVTATADGFQQQGKPVVIAIGQITETNFILGVKGTTAIVDVNAADVSLIQTESGSIQTTYTEKQITDVPNPGNDLTYIAQTAPGSVMSDKPEGTGDPGNFSSFGMPAVSNLYTINGANEMDPFVNSGNVGAFNMVLGNNDLSEATVVSIGSAEYGQLSGAQLNAVTKSGTNKYHGNAQYGWNGRALNANDYFNNRTGTARPFDNVNQWAAAVGGPIIKEKLFFFADYEGIRSIQPTSVLVTIPSASLETTALASVPASETSFYQQIFALYNNAPGASRATAVASNPDILQFQSTVGNFAKEYLIAARVDSIIGPKDRAYAHMRIDRGVQPVSTDPINPVFSVTTPQNIAEGQLGETHTFNSSLFNQATGTIMHYAEVFPTSATQLALYPGTLAFNSTLPLTKLGGSNQNILNGRNVTQYGFLDDVNKLVGTHSLKAGIDFKRVDYTSASPANSANPSTASETRTSFLAGNSSSFSQKFPLKLEIPLAQYTLGFYVQDAWKVMPNLLITAGIRFEHNSNPVCQISCFSKMISNFQQVSNSPTIAYNAIILTGQKQAFRYYQEYQAEPRIGFAWSPYGVGSSFVVRGAAGIYADYYPGQLENNFTSNLPFAPSFSVSGGLLEPSLTGSAASSAAASNAAFKTAFASGGSYSSISTAVVAAGGTYSKPSFTNTQNVTSYPTNEEWTLSVEQQLGQHTMVSVAYVGVHGYHGLIQNNGLNGFNNATSAHPYFTGLPTTQPNPSFGSVTEDDTIGLSNYNGLILSSTHRGRYITAQLNYTWSHALDELSNGGVYGTTSVASSRELNPYNLRQANYGNSDFDARHYISGSYIAAVPYYHGPKLLLDGWQVSGTVFAHSGHPFSVIDGATSLSANYYSNSLLATELVPSPSKCGRQATNASCLGTPATSAASPGSRFGYATSFAGQRRNQFYTPNYFNTDLSVTKEFGVPRLDNLKVKLGIQLFNAFNHANFGPPGNDVSNSSTFGLLKSTLNTPTSIIGENLGGDSSMRMGELIAKIQF